MADLFDVFPDAGDLDSAPLTELKVGADPAMVIFFTTETEAVLLHYEQDPAVHSYLVCPGPDCPICRLGSKPEKFGLIPVVNVDSQDVEVLRVPSKRGADALLPQLAEFLRAPNLDGRGALISRDKSYRWRLTSVALEEHSDRGELAVQRFLDRMAAGSDLASAYYRPTAAELADVDRIKRRLGMIAPRAAQKRPPSTEPAARE